MRFREMVVYGELRLHPRLGAQWGALGPWLGALGPWLGALGPWLRALAN